MDKEITEICESLKNLKNILKDLLEYSEQRKSIIVDTKITEENERLKKDYKELSDCTDKITKENIELKTKIHMISSWYKF